jgi:hypothetical protein
MRVCLFVRMYSSAAVIQSTWYWIEVIMFDRTEGL